MDDGAGDYYLGSSDEESDGYESEFDLPLYGCAPAFAGRKSSLNNRYSIGIKGNKDEAICTVVDQIERRRFIRCNSTSTVKITNTMRNPNHEATIEVIAREIYRLIDDADSKTFNAYHIRSNLRRFNFPSTSESILDDSFSDSEDSSTISIPCLDQHDREYSEGRAFGVELPLTKKEDIYQSIHENPQSPQTLLPQESGIEYIENHRQKLSSAELASVSPMLKPTVGNIRKHLKEMFFTAQCSQECNIICLIYIRRLLECTGEPSGLTPLNWKVIMMTALLLASKVWDDLSMLNEDFSYFTPYSLDQINKWELEFLTACEYKVGVNASEYARVYFDLRKRAIKCGYDELPDKELDVHQAVKLEALSMIMEDRLKQMEIDDMKTSICSALPEPPGQYSSSNQKSFRERTVSDIVPNKVRPRARFVID